MPPRKRVRQSADSNDGLENALARHVKSACWIRHPPEQEARKSKQRRLLQEAPLWRALRSLEENLSFNKTSLKKAIKAILLDASWRDQVSDEQAWIDKQVCTLQNNLTFLRRSLSKEPYPQWAKSIVSSGPPVEKFVAEQLAGGSQVSAQDAHSEQEGHDGDDYEASSEGGDSMEREVEEEKAAEAAEAASAAEPPKQKEAKVAHDVGGGPQYVYGWNFEMGMAWRSPMINGKATEKIYAEALANKKPLNWKGNIWAIWNDGKPDHHQKEIPEMPLDVFASRYRAQATWLFKQSDPTYVAAPPPEASAPKDAAPARPPLVPEVPQVNPKPDAKEVIDLEAPEVHDKFTGPNGELISLVNKRQAGSGRNDIYQILVDKRQVVQTPMSGSGFAVMRQLVRMMIDQEVSGGRHNAIASNVAKQQKSKDYFQNNTNPKCCDRIM